MILLLWNHSSLRDVSFAHRTGACDVQKVATRKALDAVIHLELAETNRASGVAFDDLLDVQNAVFFLMEPDDATHISSNR